MSTGFQYELFQEGQPLNETAAAPEMGQTDELPGRYYLKIGSVKLNPKRLQRFSRRIRKERGNKCERCGGGGADEIHHLLEKHMYPMFAFEPDNVVVLCDGCHRKATTIERTEPDMQDVFYSRFPSSVLNRINDWHQRALKLLAEKHPWPIQSEEAIGCGTPRN